MTLKALATGIAMLALCGGARASPFSFVYAGTVETTHTTNPTGIVNGDPVIITVTLDNGGSSSVSQSWTAAALRSVAFQVNNGGIDVTFSAPFGGGLDRGDGSFVTDAMGQLTAVMTSWIDVSIGPDFVTNTVGFKPTAWFLNAINNVLFFDPVIDTEIGLAKVTGDTDPANWSLVSRTAVPEPATLGLLGLGLAGLAVVRRRGIARA